MIAALRLTTMMVWLPVVSAAALQVPPREPVRPIEPRAVKPRVVEPRKFEPRIVEPRFDKWHELEDMRFELHDKMLESRFDMDVKLSERLHDLDMSMKRMEIDTKHFEANAKRFEMDAMFDKSLWKSESFGPSGKRSESFSTSPRAAWLQGDPADSLYKSARELLNGGEWRRAASAFSNLPQRFPNSGYAPEAMYWQAFALYRIGGTEDLNAALRSLETLRSRYPQARTQSDAAALMTRIRGTLASRGDRSAETALKETMSQQGSVCDREDQAVRSEAMKTLAQTDPAAFPALARRVLAKKDPCSAPLRRTAVYLLGNTNDSEVPAILRDVALNDPENEVRSTALQYLARSPSDVAVNTLEEVLRTSTDQSVLRSAARALASNPNPKARTAVRSLIERSDAPVQLRVDAVSGFENSERTTDADVTYLRGVYTKIEHARVKSAIVRVIGRLGGEQNDAWLLGLMRNNDEPIEVRNAALERVASRNMPIAEAVRLYGSVADRQLRERLISIYRQRKEPEATDKLLDIAKNDTDYNLRTRAINALTEKNDPRAMKLLMEIIDK
jgi:HEAT repeat protein